MTDIKITSVYPKKCKCGQLYVETKCGGEYLCKRCAWHSEMTLEEYIKRMKVMLLTPFPKGSVDYSCLKKVKR